MGSTFVRPVARLTAPLTVRSGAVIFALAFVTACAKDTTSALTVEAMPSPAGAEAAEPFVALARDGAVTMSWLERAADSTVALHFATLDPIAHTWSTPREVMRRSDLFVNWADFPSLVTLSDGRLLAHWLQRNGTGRYSYDVHLSESRDGGATWGASVLPHAAGVAAEHGFVTILPTADGGASIVLLDGTAGVLAAPATPTTAKGKEGARGEHGGPMQLGHATWSNGAVTATATLDPRTCDCCQTATAMTTRGPVVIYRDRSDDEVRDMSIVRFVDGQWTAPAPVHTDGWKIDFCPVNGPAVSALGDTVVAVWYTAAQDTARVRLAYSTDGGASFGVPMRVDGGLPAGRVDVELLDGGAALVSWIERLGGDGAEVRARVVRRDGTVEPHLVVSPSSGTRSSGFPRMVRTADGAVMAWTVPGTPSTVRVARVRVGTR